MKITHHNPDSLSANPAFSQAITVEGEAKLVFVGGQNGVNARGELVGNDLGQQSEQALTNALLALKEVGATQKDVVKLTIYLVGDDLRPGFAAAQKIWGKHPTTISVLRVVGLARPDALVEVEAIAAIKP